MGHAVKGGDGKWTVRCRAHAAGGNARGPEADADPFATSVRVIHVQRDGRRSYITGDTIAVRGLLYDGGCHWDADRKAWWIGSHDEALQIAERARTAPAEAMPRKKITNCLGCGCGLDDFQIRRGFKFCSSDCAIEQRMGSGWSGYVNGAWHQGSDD